MDGDMLFQTIQPTELSGADGAHEEPAIILYCIVSILDIWGICWKHVENADN